MESETQLFESHLKLFYVWIVLSEYEKLQDSLGYMLANLKTTKYCSNIMWNINHQVRTKIQNLWKVKTLQSNHHMREREKEREREQPRMKGKHIETDRDISKENEIHSEVV